MVNQYWIVVFCIFLCSCSPRNDNEPLPKPSDTNNSAVLTGTQLGQNIAANSNLRKELITELRTPNSSFEVGAAYATRPSQDRDAFYWAISVKNTSLQTKCFVEVKDIQLLNSQNQVVLEEELAFATGQVGFSNAIETGTCLAAGETSYILGIELDSYAQITKISLGSLSPSSNSFNISGEKIIPQSYTIRTSGLLKTLSVTIEHKGTNTLQVGRFSKFILLDQAGIPLTWGFFDTLDWNGAMAEGDAKNIEGFLFFEGSSNRVRVMVDFEIPDGSLGTNSAELDAISDWNVYKKNQYQRWLELQQRD